MTTINASLLLGAWRLASWQLVAADGSVTNPFGEAPLGRILYEAGGHMAVLLMRPSGNPLSERAGFIAYSGRFELHDEAVHHLIDMASDPALMGTIQVRQMRLANDELVLSALNDAEPYARHILSWRRATG